MDPHIFKGTKRVHSGYPLDGISKKTTLVGNYWTKPNSHNDSISIGTRHQQQEKRQFRQFSPAPHFVSVWDQGIPSAPEFYRDLVTISPGRLDRASASSSESSPPEPPFQGLPASPLLSYSSQNSLILFGNVMRDERRHQPRLVAKYPTDSGSDETRTLHGSQGGGLECMFDTSENLSYTFASEGLGDYQPTEELGYPVDRDITNYPELVPSQDQDAQDLGFWPQHEIDPPWTHIDTSHSQTTVLTQRPRTSWSEELLGGPADGFAVQQPNPLSIYPSHISSLLSNASWHPSEMVLLTSALELPDAFLNYAQGSSLDEDLVFREHPDLSGTQAQDGSERESSQFLPLIYNLHNSSAIAPYYSINTSGSFQTIPEEFTPKEWPTPMNEQLPNHVNQTTDKFPPNSQPIPNSVANPFQPLSEGASSATVKAHKWEHTIVSGGSIQHLNNPTMFKSCKKKKGRRKGALPVDTARKAREVRHNRACWRCWLLHLSCSVEEVCDKCQNPTYFRVCNKAHLYDYTELFFPELVVARRHPLSVQQLIKENITGFTENKIQVQLSSGPAYPPMTLTVHEFVPKNDDFLFLYWAPPELNSPMPDLERIYAPPLGLFENKHGCKLRDICQDHFKFLIKHSQFSKDATNGDAAPVAWEVYEAVDRFRKSQRILGNDELIRKVTKLLAMHFVMSRVINFTQDSARKVVQNLQSPMQLQYKYNVSSKLLNLQVKREINMLQHELTSEILEKLQTELRRKSRASWATAFCVTLMLSMCMEAVQLAIDAFIVQKMLENNGPNTLPASRDDGFDIARRLDNHAFKGCVDIFHMIYRSGESAIGPNRGGFNPIRDGIELDKAQGIDEDTVKLVNEIRGIMRHYHEELEKKTQPPTWNSKGDVLADHYRFRKENSGRLVAMFLKSFYEVS